RYTRSQATKGGAPSDATARIYDGGIAFITLYSGRIMNGSSTCTIATYTAKRLKIIFSGSWMIPKFSSAPLTTPSRCSSTTHATVRTNKEVQKGSKTKNSRIAALVPDCCDRNQAVG